MNRESGGKSRFPKKVDSPPGSEKLSDVQDAVDCSVTGNVNYGSIVNYGTGYAIAGFGTFF